MSFRLFLSSGANAAWNCWVFLNQLPSSDGNCSWPANGVWPVSSKDSMLRLHMPYVSVVMRTCCAIWARPRISRKPDCFWTRAYRGLYCTDQNLNADIEFYVYAELGCYKWVPLELTGQAHLGGLVPNGAVIGGWEYNKPTYVARAKHEGCWEIGKLNAWARFGYSYFGKEYEETRGEVLVASGRQVRA